MRPQEDDANFCGPLRVCAENPRYMADDRGQAIYLTGSHTWANLVDHKAEGDPDFDYDQYLDFMVAHNHNFIRLWARDHPNVGPWTDDAVRFEPMPYARTGPGLAQDGGPKFDVQAWNPAFFERLRSRVTQAAERGIYVSVMFFEGWSICSSRPGADVWPCHPYHALNNVNGVDGDANGNGRSDIYSLEVPETLELQEAFVRQVIDTVNDLDNALYEIANETHNKEQALPWQLHMIDFVHDYEKRKPKQHPVGMTGFGGAQNNVNLLASAADWTSPSHGAGSDYRYDPPASDGTKVILADTDHIWGIGGTYQWVWKCFLRGLNPLFMDPWSPLPGRVHARYSWGGALNDRDYPDWALLRTNMGRTRQYAARMRLNAAVPCGDLASSGYCLAEPGRAYLIYAPEDGQLDVDLSDAQGDLTVEWFNPRTGAVRWAPPIAGGRRQHLISPFGMDSVLYIHS
jgi:hypothetical protein